MFSYWYGGPFQVPQPLPARPAGPDLPEKGIYLPPLSSPGRRRQVQDSQVTGFEYRLGAPRGDRDSTVPAIQRPQWAGIS
jgi:hypothetical protein